MIPNTELNFRLEFWIDVGNFGSDQRIKRVESGFEDTGLKKDHCNLLEVLYFEGKHPLRRLNVIGSLHDFDKNIFSDFSDQMQTFGQFKQFLSFSSDLVKNLKVSLILWILFLELVRICERLPPVSFRRICIFYLLIASQ
jgi:hypothetical protein